MKGNFDDDNRVSSEDAEKMFGSNSGIFKINFPAFCHLFPVY